MHMDKLNQRIDQLLETMKKTRVQANYALQKDARKLQTDDFDASQSLDGLTKGVENQEEYKGSIA